MLKTITTAFIACMGLMVACNNAGNDVAQLESNTWKLVTLEGESNPAFAEEKESFTVNFSQQESAITGVGACNNFFGSFVMDKKGEIKIEITGATMMACPNMELEQPFFDLLNDCNAFEIENNVLTLSNGEREIATFTVLDQE